jgi:D-ala-D-ala dipeptidase
VISACFEIMRKLVWLAFILIVLSFQSFQTRAADDSPSLPNGFAYLHQLTPDVEFDIRYFTTDNFIGRQVDGYMAPKCILTVRAADALKRVQADLQPFGPDQGRPRQRALPRFAPARPLGSRTHGPRRWPANRLDPSQDGRQPQELPPSFVMRIPHGIEIANTTLFSNPRLTRTQNPTLSGAFPELIIPPVAFLT